MTFLVVRAMGASNILINDLNAGRLETAKHLGATHTLLTTPQDKAEDIVHRAMSCQPNKSFDCCGLETTARLTVLATRSGGTCMLIGLASDEAKLPIREASVREVDILGSSAYCNDYPAALDLMASGKIRSDVLITHHFDVEEISKTYETVLSGKVMV